MLFHPLKNNRGLALIFMVLLFTAAATASVMFISLGVKIKGIQKEGTTQQRLGEIRTALQNYYLIHYDLPDPSLTTPANTVPTVLLNLPQKYRFDSNGQMIHYDRLPDDNLPPPALAEHMTTVQNIHVHGNTAQDLVAAVLVAPGPDKQIAASNQGDPYGVAGSDDLVVAVPLEAEALKIAYHAVAVLQQAARAYDQQFCDSAAGADPQDLNSGCTAKNNDADTLFLPPVDTLNNDGIWDPGTEWYDYTEPVQQIYEYVSLVNGGWGRDLLANGEYSYYWIGDTDIPPDGVNDGFYDRQDGRYLNNWYPNYASTALYTNRPDGLLHNTGATVPDNDEDVSPRPVLNPQHQSPVPPNPPYPADAPTIDDANMRPLERPVPLIDEVSSDTNGDGIVDKLDSYVAAAGGSGQGCIKYGILSNDPSRGTATLDNCSTGSPGYDLAVASGLNLFKLGYNKNSAMPQLIDPWGQQYQWGRAADYGGLAQTNSAAQDQARPLYYWSFFSYGPDGVHLYGADLIPGTLDDIGPDHIPGTADDNPADDILPADDRIAGYYVTPTIPTPIP